MIEKRPVIVIVDDDIRVLESLGELLESAGYGVRAFNGPVPFLESSHSDIDCLITDIGMPGMDGFGILEILRQERPELPVFLITARDDIADRERATAENVSGYFHKPFDVNRLLAEIGRELRRSKGGSDGH